MCVISVHLLDVLMKGEANRIQILSCCSKTIFLSKAGSAVVNLLRGGQERRKTGGMVVMAARARTKQERVKKSSSFGQLLVANLKLYIGRSASRNHNRRISCTQWQL